MARMGELVNHEGKLAQFRFSHNDTNRPVELIRLWVSPSKAADFDLVGLVPWNPSGNPLYPGEVQDRTTRSTFVINTEHWTEVIIERPIPKPRNGKEYTWRWGDRQWMKEWFPLCRDCRKMHDPVLAHCDHCNKAIKQGNTYCKGCSQ